MVQIKKILVPTDFSVNSKPAIHYACYLAKPFNATIEVVHILETPYQIKSETILIGTGDKNQTILEYVQEQAQLEMDHFIGTLRQDLPIDIHTRIETGSSYEQILRIAEEEKIDLIVMGTHGRSGISHALLGSVAEKIVRKAPCAVLTIKSNA